MNGRDARRVGAGLLLVLGLGGAWVDHREPAWLRADPLTHPFGLVLVEAREGEGEEEAAEPEPRPVFLDRATEAELLLLPGIGPVTARRILAFRDSLGTIGHLEELLAVKGIGPKRLEQLRPWLLWPGSGDSTAISSP